MKRKIGNAGFAYSELLLTVALSVLFFQTASFYVKDLSGKIERLQFEAQTKALEAHVRAFRLFQITGSKTDDAFPTILFFDSQVRFDTGLRPKTPLDTTLDYTGKLRFQIIRSSGQDSWILCNPKGTYSMAGRVQIYNFKNRLTRDLVIQPAGSRIYLTEIEELE